jgi:tRNA threonylcarbamoyladenosine biosynthesis protein TsaB
VKEVTQRLLLIDTCGETAGVALCLGQEVLATEDLTAGEASAQIVAVVRRLLQQLGWELVGLDAVGVVGGPGSFTGVRTGLAAAKGFCEAASLRIAVVSRLEVLADAAALKDGLAVLDAGRGEFYVRDVASGKEWLCAVDDLPATARGGMVVAEARLAERLVAREPVLHPLHVGDALPAVLRSLAAGESDVAFAEANYVRGEQNIYGKPAAKALQDGSL